MESVITVDGKEVGFKANALTPRLYRIKIGRDILQDLNQLKRSFDKALRGKALPVPGEDASEEEKQAYEEAVQDSQLSAIDLTIFENAAWIMARQYDNKSVPDSVDAWLEGFETFSIYEILPTILGLWQLNQHSTATPKKK